MTCSLLLFIIHLSSSIDCNKCVIQYSKKEITKRERNFFIKQELNSYFISLIEGRIKFLIILLFEEFERLKVKMRQLTLRDMQIKNLILCSISNMKRM